MSNNVENPVHYTSGKIECIDAMQSALTPEEFKGFLKGNIFKYMWRERNKKGLEDIKKANWYNNKLISVYGENNDTT